MFIFGRHLYFFTFPKILIKKWRKFDSKLNMPPSRRLAIISSSNEKWSLWLFDQYSSLTVEWESLRLPDVTQYNVPKRELIHQTNTKFTKWL
jgi:hypothetical protein